MSFNKLNLQLCTMKLFIIVMLTTLSLAAASVGKDEDRQENRVQERTAANPEVNGQQVLDASLGKKKRRRRRKCGGPFQPCCKTGKKCPHSRAKLKCKNVGIFVRGKQCVNGSCVNGPKGVWECWF